MIEFKKIKVFLIMVLIIPILVLIGFSTWIITNKLIIKPDIEVNKVLTEYLNSQEGTYNGNVLLPNSDVIGIVNNGRNTELTYYYKEKNSSNEYIECVDSNTSIGPINAGEYLIQVKYAVNDTIYTIDNIAFKISPLDITNNENVQLSFSNHPDNKFLYTGNEIIPDDLVVQYNSKTLESGQDYTIEYLNNINVGTEAIIKIKGVGNFTGTKEMQFEIYVKQLIYLKATNGNEQTAIYNGQPQKPEVKAYSNPECTEELNGVTFKFPEYAINVNEQAYLIRILATKENYEDAFIDINLTILPKELELVWDKLDYTYSGVPQGPMCSATNLIEGDTCNITSTKETNAGSYISTIQSITNTNYKLPSTNLTCNYTIKKANYTLFKTGVPSFDGNVYIEGNPINVTGFTLKDIFNKEIECEQVAEISNLKFNDGLNDSHNAIVPVRCFVPGIAQNNYNDYFGSVSINIYSVATIGNKYYGTVERALQNAVSGNEVYLVPGRNPTLRTNAEVKTNVTLYLVYEAKTFKDNTQGTNGFFADTNESTYLKNTLTINDGITLTNKGAIKIDGVTGHAGAGITAQTSGDYTQIIMNYNSSIINTGTIYCLGFIKESYKNNGSFLNVSSGTLTAPLVFYDFKGGGASVYLSKNDIFPMKVFDMPNVRPTIRINSGAEYAAVTDIYMNSSHFNQDNLYIIGLNSNSNALLKLSSGYIDMKYNSDSTPSITQGEHKVDVYGNCATGQLAVTIQKQTISTSSYYCPISWKFKINIFNSMTIKSKFEFLPGSSVTVNNNASLQIDQECVFYEEYTDTNGTQPFYPPTKNTPALLTVNGICKINSSISGRIATTNNGAQLYISSNKVSNFSDGNGSAGLEALFGGGKLYYATSNGVNLKKATLEAKGCFTTSDNFETSFSSNSYYLSKGTYWESQQSVGTFEVTYHYKDLDGNDQTQTISYNIFNGIDPTMPLISDPIRNYYTFDGWYTDESYTYGYDTINIENGGNYNLYAKYSLTEIPVNYIISYDNCETIQLVNNNIQKFTYLDIQNSILFEKPTDGSLYFDGWYLDQDNTIKLPNNLLTNDLWTEYGSLIQDCLVLYGTFSNNPKYTISFVTNNENAQTPSQQVVYNANDIVLPDMSLFAGDVNSSVYFDDWYVDAECTIKFNNNMSLTSDITLYGKWNNKYIVNYLDYDGNVENTIYVMPTNSIALPSNYTKTDDQGPYNTRYIFNYWLISGGQHSGGSVYTPLGDVDIQPIMNVIKYCTIEFKSEYVASSIKYTNLDGTEVVINATISENKSETVEALYGTSVTYAVTGYGSLEYGGYQYTFNGKTQTQKPNAFGRNNKKTLKETNLGNITQHSTFQAVNTNDTNGGCLIEGTLITLANGTTKKVEDLNGNDMLLVFNHETGMLDKAYAKWLIHKENEPSKQRILYLTFSDGTEIGIVVEHGFFDKDKLEYVYINENNVDEYIGHNFYTINNSNHSVKLISYRIEEKLINIYSPISNYHMNCFANGMLTMSNFLDGFINIFKLDENMKYDEELMKKDLEMYGEGIIEEFLVVANEDIIKSFPYKYVKVSMGKGKLTYEEIEYLVKTFLTDDNKL